MKARVFVRLGRLGEALAWARSQDLSAEDELTYVREFEHITLARLLLARTCTPEALALLHRLLLAAHEGGRIGSVIEILALQALAQQSRGQMHAALVPLERALRLADPEGYARVFVDEGAPMTFLLQSAARQEIAPKYVRQLLASVSEAPDRATPEQNLIEPLSERELDVPVVV
jgi:LuxR family maltose regulon positive regulatory protein